MKKENVITAVATGVIFSIALVLSLNGDSSEKDVSPTDDDKRDLKEVEYFINDLDLQQDYSLSEQRQIKQYDEYVKYQKYVVWQEQLKKQEEERKRLAKIEAEKKTKEQKQNNKVNITSTSNVLYEGTFNVTFYTAHQASTGKSKGHPQYGITASGTTVKEGRTAACPKNLPFGTVVEIEGVGKRVCEDRGSAINNAYKIDIYVSTEKEAYSLGRKNLYGKVYK